MSEQKPHILYREARARDGALVLQFIQELAEYEKLRHECVATQADIDLSLFGPEPKAFCLLAEIDQKPAGFALYFYNYSTFQGRAGIYIEDLYVREEFRGNGIGKGFFKLLAQKAIKDNLGRIQWWVLDWNEPSIAFYKSMEAVMMDDWTVCRLEGEAIKKLAAV